MHDNPFESPAEKSAVATPGLAGVPALFSASIALMRRAPGIFAVVAAGHLLILFVGALVAPDDPKDALSAGNLVHTVAFYVGYTALFAIALAALEPPPRAVPVRARLDRLLLGLVATLAYIVVTYVGMLVLFVPGVLFGVRYVFCVPLVLEGTRVGDAFRESEDLVKGRWWGIAGRGLVGMMPTVLTTVGAFLLARSTGDLRSPLPVQVVSALVGVWQLAYYLALYESARETA